jgi:glycosyltransferase involved in cell wall biosynthesis
MAMLVLPEWACRVTKSQDRLHHVTKSQEQPCVTIVVPTRNRLPLLREAVDSVRSQSFGDWELVVVDDASEDGTTEWVGRLDEPRLRTIQLPEQLERTVARNRGLEAARGEFVLFLDDDDRLAPGALDALSTALACRPEAVAAVGAAVRFDPDGQRERVPHPRRRSVRSVWREVLAGWDSGSGQAVFRARALREAGGWNEQLTHWELGDLWFRVSLVGPVVFLPEIVLEIRLHAGQSRPNPAAMDSRAGFIAALPEPDRSEAKRILRARELVLAGDEARFRGDYGPALSGYLRAAATAPLVVRSPLIRTDLLGNVAHVAPRALLGRRGRASLRRLRQFARGREV